MESISNVPSPTGDDGATADSAEDEWRLGEVVPLRGSVALARRLVLPPRSGSCNPPLVSNQ